jgi:lycopene cyclase domain-containing protein
LIVTNLSKAYTAVNFAFLAVIIVLGTMYKLKLLQQFYISFLIILIPFIIVNGILTGAVTETPIVWYNDLENLGIRFYTIPVEDFGYAFSMLFGNALIFETLNKY